MADSKTAVSGLPDHGMATTEEISMPRWKRVWRHSLTQMILLSIQAFCGPAMADAIAGKFLLLFLNATS